MHSRRSLFELADLDAGRNVTVDEIWAHFEKRRIARRTRKAT